MLLFSEIRMMLGRLRYAFSKIRKKFLDICVKNNR